MLEVIFGKPEFAFRVAPIVSNCSESSRLLCLAVPSRKRIAVALANPCMSAGSESPPLITIISIEKIGKR